MEERRVSNRRQGTITVQIESLVWFFMAALAGVYFPIAADMLSCLLTGSTGASTIMMFVTAIVAGYLCGKSIKTLKSNRFAGWIAPTIGFSIIYGAYLVLAAAALKDQTYLAVLLVFGLFLLIKGGPTAWSLIISEPKPHPAMVLDKVDE